MPRAIPLTKITATGATPTRRSSEGVALRAKSGRAAGEDEERGDADPPVPPIGEITAERDTNEGKRFGETDEAESGVVREPIDLPADNDGLELRADDHREEADDEPAELAMAKRGVRVVRLGRRDERRRGSLEHRRTISTSAVEW
jgi:hypothetical protein